MIAWPEGVGRSLLDRVDSTNAGAARRASEGEAGPLWIMAREQTAARGRQGRGWISPRGNLTASLLLRPGGGPVEAALHSFAAALAVADLAAVFLPHAQIALKWPNDVLVGGRKIAGILLESASRSGRLDWLVIGIGVNLVAAPEDAAIRPGGTPATCLAAAGARPVPDPETALAILAGAMAHWTGLLAREGFAPLRAAWLGRAARLGQPLVASLPQGPVTGTFADLDLTGALVLTTPAGPRRIAAADIFFPE